MRWILRLDRNLHRDQRGASAVEFALVSIPLLLLLMGVVDFGLGIWTYNNLAEGVRAGARYAVVRGYNTMLPSGAAGPGSEGLAASPIYCDAPGAAKVVPVVCAYSVPLDPTKLGVWSEWNGGNTIGKSVTVTGAYTYTPFLTNLFNVTINLRSQSTMEIACCN